jgi:hypothetical protein
MVGDRAFSTVKLKAPTERTAVIEHNL